jgi:hypothetical protein
MALLLVLPAPPAAPAAQALQFACLVWKVTTTFQQIPLVLGAAPLTPAVKAATAPTAQHVSQVSITMVLLTYVNLVPHPCMAVCYVQQHQLVCFVLLVTIYQLLPAITHASPVVLGVAHVRPITTVLLVFLAITLTPQHGPASSALPSV